MKYRSIVCTIILFMVLSITVGFSSFVSEMSISKIVADVRVEKDVRITSVAISGAEVHNVDNISTLNFDEDSILFDNMFASMDDYIELSATITNIGSAEVGVFDIVVPNGIGFEITNYNIGEKLCDNSGQCNLGSRTEFIVRIFPYSEAAFYLERVNVDFDFRQFYDVTYKNILKENHKIIGGDEIILRFGSDMPTPSGFIIYENDVLLTEGEDYELYVDYLWVFNIEGDLIIEAVYEYEYGFTGGYQTFIAPVSGKYKIELWGAQGGGDGSFIGGKGAYTSGEIDLSKNTELYVYVGQYDGGFNNGGYTRWYEWLTNSGYFYAGGGATDVRLKSGSWDLFDGLKSRIMVAAGGGGAVTYYTYQHGGSGGGLIGYDGAFVGADGRNATGGTQTSGGEIGIVSLGNAYFGKAFYDTARGLHSIGGSGYYAGGSGSHGANTIGSGAGGSSYISGHNGCNSIAELSTESLITHTGNSIHYSGYGFTNTKMIDGEGYQWTTAKSTRTGMPSKSDGSPVIGNEGDGYAKITFIE